MDTAASSRTSAETRSSHATLLGLLVGLLASVPLWWWSGGTWMSVQDFRRWVALVAGSAFVMTSVGAVLLCSQRTRHYGAGVLVGTAWAVLADVTWWSVAASSAD